jgi:peptidoglycan/xylan/chitin deacetylase (PgdA/CDA1 family)
MWTRTPALVQDLFPQILWRIPTEAKVVYLTFDDGPDPRWTPEVLRLLDRHRARATFFAVGKKAEAHPELVRAAATAGHSIGSHGFEHRSLLFAFGQQLLSQIERADDAIARAIGAPPRLFRPPFGHAGPALMRACRFGGRQLVLWEIDSGDYSSRSRKSVISKRILKHLQPGSIVLMHDGNRNSGTTVAALEEVLPEIGRRGYRCLPLAQSVTGKEAAAEAGRARILLGDFAIQGFSQQSSVTA